MASLQFAPFGSEIELPFYTALFSSKLDYDKLDDSARHLVGLYEPRSTDPELSCRMQILGNALSGPQVPLGSVRADGIIKNVNTMEDFKNTDKTAMLQTAGRQIWDAIKDGTIYSVPSLLSSFTILSFADLKKYKFSYWFAFPALHSDPTWKRVGQIGRLTSEESTALVERVGTWRYSVDGREHGFFLVKRVPHDAVSAEGESLPYRWEVGSLRDFESGFFADVADEDRFISFVDSSTYEENPSWPLRNLLVLIRQRFHLTKAKVICFRDVQARRHEARSIILRLEMDSVDSLEVSDMPRVTGWERNLNNKLTFKTANLGEYMDPTRLADQAVDLNLKLMKWRITPNIDLDVIKGTKCLLLGAGTLGGYVSRNLMGWGVRKITFVDYGRVSYSNPVRQPLFEFKHCQNGGEPKAIQAAKTLKEIYPGVDSEGHSISVPMLGHPFTDEARTKADYEKLKGLIDAHDVVFLLMDTRESRWLPTVMGKAAGKIVMNAALGFDTFVAMRHGAELEDKEATTLGCYFCNDVVAPTDSIKDQTLDQQCTVTRPGVAAIASAVLVELLTSLLQHPLGNLAPAPAPAGPGGVPPRRDPEDHPLGLVPHQIRGYLAHFQNMVIKGESYPSCSACSPRILAAYRGEGWEFVKRALMEKDYVAELSGLAEVQRMAEKVDNDLDWEEGEEEGDGEMI